MKCNGSLIVNITLIAIVLERSNCVTIADCQLSCDMLIESNCVTIINCQLNCDMLLMIAVLSSKMPKTDICRVILRGLLVPSSIYLCVHLPNLFGT